MKSYRHQTYPEVEMICSVRWANTPTGRLLVMLMLLTFMVGCTTMRPVPLTSGRLTDTIKVGDQIQARTHDGKSLNIKVTSIDANRVSGDDQSIRLDEIATLERKELSKLTAGLIAVGYYVVVLGAAYISIHK